MLQTTESENPGNLPSNDPAIDSHQASRERLQRWCIYLMLIACSMSSMVARLWMVEGESYGESVPFLSANDRSRWITIRSLGDHNTFAIDEVLQTDDGFRWDSIDKVMHTGRDGKPHFYSSKPTLLPWLLAYEYWGIKELTGKDLENDTFFVVRLMLLLSQVLPMLAFFLIMGGIAERLAKTDWARFFVVACATFGTFLTTFAITLNNHIFAAISAAIVAWCLIAIWKNERSGWHHFLFAGLFSAFAAANDLPALSLVAVAGGLCLLRSPSRTIVGFVPAAALVIGGFFVTNYLAHDDWRPPYAHRDDGEPVATVTVENSKEELETVESLDQAILPMAIKASLVDNAAALESKIESDSQIARGSWPIEDDVNRWLIENPDHSSRVIIVNKSGSNQFSLHRWENWYEYPGSYWRNSNSSKANVDRGEKNASVYATHFLVGHHGVFSLSPIWIWAIPGVLLLCFSSEYKMRLLGIGILLISIAVIGFYVTRPELDRGYGGMTSGPRWLFWLIPLWLVAMIPLLDKIDNWFAMKVLALITLFISAGSASYAWANPWVNPWIYEHFFRG